MSDLQDQFQSAFEEPDSDDVAALTRVNAVVNGISEEFDDEGLNLISDKINVGKRSLDDQLVKAYLDEVLLMFLLARDGACGQDLIRDLYRMGCSLSQGTIYPRLHDLAAEGVLEMHEQRQTKQFEVVDPDEVRTRLTTSLRELNTLAVLFLLYRSDVSDAGKTE